MRDVDKPSQYEDDLFKSAQWAAWKARAKLDRALPGYSEDYFDESEEVRLFEGWLGRFEGVSS